MERVLVDKKLYRMIPKISGSSFFLFLILIYLAEPSVSCGMQDLQWQHVGSSSLTKNQTQDPVLGVQSLSCGTTRKVPLVSLVLCCA